MSKKVLLVEDEPIVLRHLSFCVRSAGWSCMTATDRETALAAIQDWRPDVVVVDLEIPAIMGDIADESIGRGLIEAIGEFNETTGHRTRIVILSAFKGNRDGTADIGLADLWMTKPVACDELRSGILNIVEGS